MTQKTITCNTTVEAEGLRARLMEEGIQSVRYDETNSKVARGIMDATMDIMVREEDYDRAKAIYDQMLKEQEAILPWCPKCGSENTEKLTEKEMKKGRLAAFLASCAANMFLGFLFKNQMSTEKYRCKDCGKVFEH